MWPCARTDIVHPQRSYLTVGRLKFTQWRSAFRRCSQFAGGEPSEKFLVVDVNTCFSVKQIRSAIIFMCSFHSGMRSFHLVTCYFHLIMHSLHLVMCSFYLVACVLFIRPSVMVKYYFPFGCGLFFFGCALLSFCYNLFCYVFFSFDYALFSFDYVLFPFDFSVQIIVTKQLGNKFPSKAGFVAHRR